MKGIVLLLIGLFISLIGNTQSDLILVEKTIENYIEGNTYCKLDLLKSAFAKDATLHLTVKGESKLLSVEEYLAFFKKAVPNKFTGRTGKILQVNVEENIAFVKIELSIPNKDFKFVDFMLLKKKAEEWKIISKTATKVKIRGGL